MNKEQARPSFGTRSRMRCVPARYGPFWRWLWRDAVWRHRKSIALNLVMTGLAVICQCSALYVLYTSVKALEKDRTLSLLEFELHARSSPGTILLAATLIGFVLLVISTVVAYLAERNAVRLRRRYEEFCRKRVLCLLSYLPHPSATVATEMLQSRALTPSGKKESRYAGRMLKVFLSAMLPFGTLLAYAVILFSISLVFSIVIVILFLISTIFLHRINAEAAAVSRRSEELWPAASREYRRLTRRIEECSIALEDQDPELTDAFSKGSISEYQTAFFSRFVVREKTRLVVSLLRAVSLLCIVLCAGAGMINDLWSWSVLLAYLVALTCFLGSLGRVGRTITEMSRFYPQVRRYHDLVVDVQPFVGKAFKRHPRSVVSGVSDDQEPEDSEDDDDA